MCLVRRGSRKQGEEMTTEGVGGGLKGGATSAACQHRTKKALFKSKEVRKKLKTPKRVCEDCERLQKSGQPVPSCSVEVSICVTCAHLACEEHATKHCEAPRSGESHPFLLSLNSGTIRCHPCDIDLEPLEDVQDPIRLFYNEYKSFVKIKSDTNTRKESVKDSTAPVVEGKPLFKEQPSVETSTSITATKTMEREKERAKENGGSEMKSIMNGKSNGQHAMDGNTMIPAKGLSNLGNTCFFNSVMQCVMHTHHLQFYFAKFGRVSQLEFSEKTVLVNEEKVLLEKANISVGSDETPLNNVVRGFLGEFRSGTTPSPAPVFSQISRKAPRFKGWQQQDAHELLRYLMDGLRSEELERYRTSIASHLGVSASSNPKKLDPQIVKLAKGYMNAAGRPLLDAVFGGTLLQTIRCCECGHVSERHEQFLDLSVPMASNPMSASRTTAGRTSSVSSHQKKKAEKLAKKNSRKAARKAAVHRNGSVEEPEGKDEDDLADEINALDVSDTEEESDADSDERIEAGADPLDYTKMLVSPPVEYYKERSIGSCLLEFTAEERLAGPNAYECEKCCAPRNKKVDAKGSQKKKVEALKRYLIFEPPAVLTLHLKRFQQLGGMTGRLSTRKLGGHIDFPLVFDIAPFCCKNVERIAPGQKKVLYSLYGVVVHSGDLSGGHYIAYVKSRNRIPHAQSFLESARAGCVDAQCYPATARLDIPSRNDVASSDGQWYFCSDSKVNAVPESRVLSAEAYILFYERIQ